MPFDWPHFLERHHIEYTDHGPNVGRDHIATQCPMCGHLDRSKHMSISLDGKGWHCWRDQSHAGVSPTRLVQALLKCDWSQAAAITGNSQAVQITKPHSFLEQVNYLLAQPEPIPSPPITIPTSARPLTLTLPVARPYQSYLRQRGFTDMPALAPFDLLFDARDRRWHGRILFPVHAAAKVVAITGRAISDRAKPRYLADGINDTTPLIWADRMPKAADLLVLTEGPFDALKVNLLGNPRGIWATCCMTSSFSQYQRAQLYELLPRFKRSMVLFDKGNEGNAYRMANSFPAHHMHVGSLPDYAKDPAELRDLHWSTVT